MQSNFEFSHIKPGQIFWFSECKYIKLDYDDWNAYCISTQEFDFLADSELVLGIYSELPQ